MTTFWDERRNKATFEDAAREAIRELYPELEFTHEEPAITLCRVCKGEGYHIKDCKLIKPDGKDKAFVEDLFAAAPDAEKERKPLIEVERDRLKALDITPAKAEKVKKAIDTSPSNIG